MTAVAVPEPLALAYVNHGRWVADCPRPFCGSAQGLYPWQPWFTCTSAFCAVTVPVSWPREAAEISAVLAARGAPQWQNWFPARHPLALAARCPHGQTVDDLLAENAAHGPEIEAWEFFGRQVERGAIVLERGR